MVRYFHFCFNCLTSTVMLELKLYLCIIFGLEIYIDTGLFKVLKAKKNNYSFIILNILKLRIYDC